MLDFHSRHAGETSAALSWGRTDDGCSSYDLLARMAPSLAGRGSLLDIGCGDGYLLERVALHSPDSHLLGIDISRNELERAGARVPSATLLLANARALPFATGTIDCVISHMVFMLIDDVLVALSEVARVLKPGGTFCAIVGGQVQRGDAFEVFIRLHQEAAKSHRAVRVAFGDPRTRDPDALRALVEEVGAFERDVEVRDLVLRLDGDLERVWHCLSHTYCMHFLTDAGRREVFDRFRVEAAALAREPTVPCSMGMRLLRCQRAA